MSGLQAELFCHLDVDPPDGRLQLRDGLRALGVVWKFLASRTFGVCHLGQKRQTRLLMQMQLGISMKRDQIEAVEKRADNQIIHHAVGYHK